jgi:hypothetical protein
VITGWSKHLGRLPDVRRRTSVRTKTKPTLHRLKSAVRQRVLVLVLWPSSTSESTSDNGSCPTSDNGGLRTYLRGLNSVRIELTASPGAMGQRDTATVFTCSPSLSASAPLRPGSSHLRLAYGVQAGRKAKRAPYHRFSLLNWVLDSGTSPHRRLTSDVRQRFLVLVLRPPPTSDVRRPTTGVVRRPTTGVVRRPTTGIVRRPTMAVSPRRTQLRPSDSAGASSWP